MTDDVVVRATGLKKTFGETVAVDGVDLEVRRGEILGLLGPNGAGKTTTVKMLTTLYRPTSGTASILGHDVGADPKGVRREIGYVPQELTSDGYLTAQENLRLYANLYHLPPREIPTRIEEVLRLVALENVEGRLVKTFSGGMKKKLDLACGLLHHPRVLFLDEPSLGLDVQSRRAVWDHVLALKKSGVTLLVCTNDMDEADRLCDRVAIIFRGKVVALDAPSGLKDALGGDVVTLQCARTENGAVATLDRAVKALDFVRDTLVAGNRLLVYVESHERAIPRVLDAARAAGVEIESLSYTRPHLEDVFLRHTGAQYSESHVVPEPKKGRR
ncbi:MAG: ATP-binding cassette domain-containing protein [Planctomycetes bacterium]|nr:ATP-binding cassette domain-containing protein [Planctomycetota bacterium]MBI3847321.1 ATP-binding cassette domain-containing protein [Planctomycetota bacterium]